MIRLMGLQPGRPGSDAGYSRHWLRGRWHGAPVVGVNLKVVVDFTDWRWVPTYLWYCNGIHWLCFRTWHGWEYDLAERTAEPEGENG